MAKFVVFVGVLLYPLAAVAADPPFMPVSDAVDHVVNMTVKRGWGPPTTDRRTVTHHAGWTRIDTVENDRPSTAYFGHRDELGIDLQRGRSGKYDYLSMLRGPDQHRSVAWTYHSFKTGELQVVLGETCHVWVVQQARDANLTKHSCVTDDGVELWFKYTGNYGVISSGEAASIERRSVQPSEVHPPADLLDLRSWLDSSDQLGAAATPRGAPGDFAVVMAVGRVAPADAFPSARTTRRHHPWTLTQDRRHDGGRILSIENAAAHLNLRVESDAAGDFKRLLIISAPLPTDDAFKPVNTGQRETILREECTWFDMTPGMMDAGLAQCRTQDEIVLKETHTIRGGGQTLQAVRLSRSPVGLADVLPPPDVLRRETWGIPN